MAYIVMREKVEATYLRYSQSTSSSSSSSEFVPCQDKSWIRCLCKWLPRLFCAQYDNICAAGRTSQADLTVLNRPVAAALQSLSENVAPAQ